MNEYTANMQLAATVAANARVEMAARRIRAANAELLNERKPERDEVATAVADPNDPATWELV